MSRIKRMGEAYSSGDVIVNLAGMQDANPSEIEYGYAYAHEMEMGLKREPRAWRMGAKTYTGTITLPLDAVAVFEKLAPAGDIALIRPFPIVVCFLNTENVLITDIVYAKFQGNARKVSIDNAIENQYDLFITGLDLNI